MTWCKCCRTIFKTKVLEWMQAFAWGIGTFWGTCHSCQWEACQADSAFYQHLILPWLMHKRCPKGSKTQNIYWNSKWVVGCFLFMSCGFLSPHQTCSKLCSREGCVTPGMERPLNPCSGSDSFEELGNILSRKMTGDAESGKGGESIPWLKYLHRRL